MKANFDWFPSKTRAGDALDYTRGHRMARDVYSDVKSSGIGKETVGQTKPESSNLGKVYRFGKWYDIKELNTMTWKAKKGL